MFTGASGTLGTAFCDLYASAYHIVAVYRRKPPSLSSQSQWFLDPLDSQMVQTRENAIFAIQADLTDERDILRIVEVALARFDRIDLLVNAAVDSCWAPIV